MGPILPPSISPHVAILQSPDVQTLLAGAGLPPLYHILQSYSPLRQITTRTIALASVPHSSFAIRFSSLPDLEAACKEDEEARAARTLDWLGGRISRRATRWSEEGDVESGNKAPWWDEVKRCVQGDWIPSKSEGWNHPVSILYAISTAAPNPLQAITALHARQLELPTWVDPAIMRFIVILHPANSNFNQDECTALLNAVKKQYGLNATLVNLSMETPTQPIPIMAMPPRLPSNMDGKSKPSQAPEVPDVNELRMTASDAEVIGRFLREYTTQSLIPWMERQVTEWNENFVSTRRLTSRLFSTSRKFWGGGSTPTSNASSYGATPASPKVGSFNLPPPPQQRRLAEFATFLGDFKLAVTVWDSMRKEQRSASEILPLLLAPSSSLSAHALETLQEIITPEPSPASQLRALRSASRWDSAIETLSPVGGDRWLAWAAGLAEEPPSALLLAYAAHVSLRAGAPRRAVMWYNVAAHRLEKAGLKTLALQFLRAAHSALSTRTLPLLSQSYEDIHKVGRSNGVVGFHSVLSTLEHSIGRLKYASGDIESATDSFIQILRGEPDSRLPGMDTLVLQDLEQAMKALDTSLESTKLPIKFCSAKDSRVHVGLAESLESDGDTSQWDLIASRWQNWYRDKGKESMDTSDQHHAGVATWIELALRNPLDCEIELSNLTLDVASEDAVPNAKLADIETIDSLVLEPYANRTIMIGFTPRSSQTLYLIQARFHFLGVYPVVEELVISGDRLNATPSQRSGFEYAPDTPFKVDVIESNARLDARLLDSIQADPLIYHGECRRYELKLKNSGSLDLEDVYVVSSKENHVWISSQSQAQDVFQLSQGSSLESFTSSSLLASWGVQQIPGVIKASDSVSLSLFLRTTDIGHCTIRLLIVYRSKAGSFFSTKIQHQFFVEHIIDAHVALDIGPKAEQPFVAQLELDNLSHDATLNIRQISFASTSSTAEVLIPEALASSRVLLPQGSSQIFATLLPSPNETLAETADMVKSQILDLLVGRNIRFRPFPPVRVLLSTLVANPEEESLSLCADYPQSVIEDVRRKTVLDQLATLFPKVSAPIREQTFPLFSPHTCDVHVLWEIAGSAPLRHGWASIPNLRINVGHGSLNEMLKNVEASKEKSMYAETQRERAEIIKAVRVSEWNLEMDPIAVRVEVSGNIEHHFDQGPCSAPVTFILQNYSTTNSCRFTLRLSSIRTLDEHPPIYLLPKYHGNLTHRGTLQPGQFTSVQAKIWATTPGLYGLGEWKLSSELGAVGTESWSTISRYEQHSMASDTVVTISNSSL